MQAGIKSEARGSPRIQLEVDVNVYSPQGAVVPGRTLDISESGISALLPVDWPIGKAVRLEIKFPFEPVTVRAVVRNRNTFRYGLEFGQPDTGRELIKKVSNRPGGA